MIRKKVLLFLIVTLIISFLTGCEKDKITAPFSVKTESNAKLLLYLEEEGDIINKILQPVIQAEEVFNNLNNYLIIDLRDNSDFLNGHIEGAKNISNDTLFNYIRSNFTGFNKVVLISASGQTAAYYSVLLRIVGFTNIYYMNYGMASWNIFFSSVWTDRLTTYPDFGIFTHTFYQKKNYSHLPEISLSSPGESMKDFVQNRADALIKEGFNEDFNSASSKTAMTFNNWAQKSEQFYLVCTGPVMLYSSNPFSTNTYHPIGAVFYQVPPDLSDFRSGGYLQTLPSDSSIAVYSGTGQESAFYTAYLRLLGYDARSVLFGMNNIDYGMLFRSPEIIPYAFKTEYIMNYPYFTGPGTKK
jgi:rhodanese-related sulfurtransferase